MLSAIPSESGGVRAGTLPATSPTGTSIHEPPPRKMKWNVMAGVSSPTSLSSTTLPGPRRIARGLEGRPKVRMSRQRNRDLRSALIWSLSVAAVLAWISAPFLYDDAPTKMIALWDVVAAIGATLGVVFASPRARRMNTTQA